MEGEVKSGLQVNGKAVEMEGPLRKWEREGKGRSERGYGVKGKENEEMGRWVVKSEREVKATNERNRFYLGGQGCKRVWGWGQ